METYNDAKLAFLEDALGVTGHIDDLYPQWLAPRVIAPVGNQTDDLELQWLREQTGVIDINVQDGWVLFMLQIGIEAGHINDMLFAFWSNTVTIPDEVAGIWPMEFDPNTAQRVRDIAKGSDGFLNTGAGLTFDGATSLVQVPNNPLHFPPGDFSVALWMDTTEDVGGLVNQWNGTGAQRSWQVGLQSAGLFRVELSGSGGQVNKNYRSVETINNGVPHLLVFRWNSALGELTMFIDTVEITYDRFVDDPLPGNTLFPCDADLLMGGTYAAGVPTPSMASTMYGFRTFFRVLSIAEINTLFNSPEQVLVPQRMHYKLDESFGEVANSPIFDSSLFGFHGDNVGNLGVWTVGQGFPVPQHVATSFTRRTLGAGIINVPQRSVGGFDAEGNILSRPRGFDFANFSGVDTNVILVPANASFANIFAGGGSVSFWYKSENNDDAPRFVRKGNHWNIRHQTAADSIRFFPNFDGAAGTFEVSSTPPGPLWHFLTVNYDWDNAANVPTAFLDGEVFVVSTLSPPVGNPPDDSATAMTIGQRGQVNQGIHGGIDLVALLRVELTLEQHQAIYEASKGTHQPEPTIITIAARLPVEEEETYSYDPEAINVDTWGKISGPAALTVNPTTGEVEWVTEPGDEGTHPVVIEAINEFGETEQSWNVTVVEVPLDPPVITSPPDTGPVDAGQPYSYQPVADPEATSWAKIDGPFDLDVDIVTGLVTWATQPGDVGNHDVEIQAVNSAGVDNQSWSLEVVEALSSPDIISNPVLDGEVGVPYSYQAIATGNPSPTFSKQSGPPSLTVSPTGLVEWTPTANDGGFNQAAIVATNSEGSDQQVWNIEVPTVPAITSNPNTEVIEGNIYFYQAVATGHPSPDWNLLQSAGGNMAIDNNGLMIWQPGGGDVGDHTIEIEAINSAGSDTQEWTLTVIADEVERLVVEDTFTDANGTDLIDHDPDVDIVGDGWRRISGNASGFVEVQGNEAHRVGAGGLGGQEYYIETPSNELRIRLTILDDEANAKLMVRQEEGGPNNGGFEIFVSGGTGVWGIHKVGGLFPLDGDDFTGGLPYTMEVIVTNTDISAEILGRGIFSHVNDTRENGATAVGITLRGDAKCDDLEVFEIL